MSGTNLRSVLFFRKSCGVHDCRCQLRPLLEQLHFMFCCRSLRIFCTEVGRTVTVTITTPTNPNMTTPQIGVITRTFFLCINVCLLLFVRGFSLTALTPEVKSAAIFRLGNCSPFFAKVCPAFPFLEVVDFGTQHGDRFWLHFGDLAAVGDWVQRAALCRHSVRRKEVHDR